jgi:diamine N-acetyltransferase
VSPARATIVLRDANPEDIPFIMACERRPGYEPFVGQWAAEKHHTTLADASFRYFIGSDEEAARGFAILRDDPLRTQNLYLKRIAVHDADKGHGRALLTALHEWIFTKTDTHRFWLEVVEDNRRGRHLYEQLGFVAEGVVREAYAKPDGTRGSFVQMSLLKPDWLGRRQ